jgi:hypothetical protein
MLTVFWVVAVWLTALGYFVAARDHATRSRRPSQPPTEGAFHLAA